MKRTFVSLLFISTLLLLIHAQEIPLGKYVYGDDYFIFLPGQKVEFRFSNESCNPAEYKGVGSYVLQNGFIAITPDKLAGIPDTAIRKAPIAAPTGIIKVHVTDLNGNIKGAAVQVVDVDTRTLTAQNTDQNGDAFLKIPQNADGAVINLMDYQVMKIRNISTRYNYEVFIEKPVGYQYTYIYLNAANGGLQYKFSKGVFSLNRQNLSCSTRINDLQWFNYKIK